MSIDPRRIQITTEIASFVSDFLPANPHPFADASISFLGCANKVGISVFWKGGSKRPAVSQLLIDTLDKASNKFCPLMIEIVNTAILYRINKNNPIKREEIITLNKLIAEIGFKIPELWDTKFLERLPSSNIEGEKSELTNSEVIKSLRQEYIDLLSLDPQKRGYAFQDFLVKFFTAYGLKPKSAFRLVGEEIDGSFEINDVVYLLEAKWQSKPTGQKDLGAFSIKVSGKSTWARGLFISYAGYTSEGLDAFARGKQTNLIGMDGQDLFFILEGKLKLGEAIQIKARQAAETNNFFVSVFELAN